MVGGICIVGMCTVHAIHASDRCTTVGWAFSAKHLILHGLWPSWAVPRSSGPSPLACNVKMQLASDQLPRESANKKGGAMPETCGAYRCPAT